LILRRWWMAEAALRHEEERGIHYLGMDHGPNALDVALMEALRARLDRLREAGAPPLVLTSAHPTLFSPGWDLKALVGAEREQVASTLRLFESLVLDLFSYPAPTAAAIGGHAVAGGCLLALTCDLRVMATGPSRLGLAELNLGVPVPAGSLLMLRSRLDPSAVEELVLRGDGFTAERARDVGLVHRVAGPDEVASVSGRELAKLASKPLHAYAATKSFLYADTWRDMERRDADVEDSFLECWFEEETRRRLDEVARSLS